MKVHMRADSPKDARELDVFRGFVASAHLPVSPESISHRPEPEPDVLCLLAGVYRYFELSEVLWERPDRPGDTLAKGFHKSGKAAHLRSTLIAQGKMDEANKSYDGRPVWVSTAAIVQAIAGTKTKKVVHAARPSMFSVTLLREHNPAEPYDLLFECSARTTLTKLLTGAVFDGVWLYHHGISNAISLRLGTTGFAEAPEQARGVVGRIALLEGRLSISFDARYSTIFNEVLHQLQSVR